MNCHGVTSEGEGCWKLGSNYGYCHQHIDQCHAGRSRCMAINTKGDKCVLPEDYENKCHIHLWRSDWATYWSIINDKEIVMSPTLQHYREYTDKHIGSTFRPFALYKKNYHTYLTKDISLTKIDVLIDLINEFIGRDYLWIAMGKCC